MTSTLPAPLQLKRQHVVLSSEEASRRVEAWKEARKPKPSEPLPEPGVRARTALESEIPRGAKLLRNAAVAGGWRARVTYARGPYLTAGGKWTGRITDSIAVRMRHPDGRAAVAVWIDGKTEYGFTWTVTESGLVHMPKKCNVTAIKQFVLWGNNAG